MNIMTRTLAALCLALAAVLPAAAQDAVPVDGQGAYVEQAEAGAINWDSGVIRATGIGAPPAGAANPAQARGMAKRAATVIARRNLLELLKGVQIDAATTLKNFMVSSDVVVSRIRGFLQNSRILDTAYMSDGSVEVTVGIALRGGVADVVLPEPAQFKPVPAGGLAPNEPLAAPESAAYTGLVIDARGLGVRPALNPRILDEQGREVYGTSLVGRNYAVQQGMVGYARSPEAARGNPRVGDNPMVVAATAAAGRSRTDIVIPDAKAEEIRGDEAGKRFLAQAKVMVVLD